jgi:hypothetical protein
MIASWSLRRELWGSCFRLRSTGLLREESRVFVRVYIFWKERQTWIQNERLLASDSGAYLLKVSGKTLEQASQNTVGEEVKNVIYVSKPSRSRQTNSNLYPAEYGEES